MTCRAHILEVLGQPRVETWRIGEDVARETYEQFRDAEGDLYVIGYPKDETTEQFVVKRSFWERHRDRWALGSPL